MTGFVDALSDFVQEGIVTAAKTGENYNDSQNTKFLQGNKHFFGVNAVRLQFFSTTLTQIQNEADNKILNNQKKKWDLRSVPADWLGELFICYIFPGLVAWDTASSAVITNTEGEVRQPYYTPLAPIWACTKASLSVGKSPLIQVEAEANFIMHELFSNPAHDQRDAVGDHDAEKLSQLAQKSQLLILKVALPQSQNVRTSFPLKQVTAANMYLEAQFLTIDQLIVKPDVTVGDLDNSTDTALAYESGRIKLYVRDESVKLSDTDGSTYSPSDEVKHTTQLVNLFIMARVFFMSQSTSDSLIDANFEVTVINTSVSKHTIQASDAKAGKDITFTIEDIPGAVAWNTVHARLLSKAAKNIYADLGNGTDAADGRDLVELPILENIRRYAGSKMPLNDTTMDMNRKINSMAVACTPMRSTARHIAVFGDSVDGKNYTQPTGHYNFAVVKDPKITVRIHPSAAGQDIECVFGYLTLARSMYMGGKIRYKYTSAH